MTRKAKVPTEAETYTSVAWVGMFHDRWGTSVLQRKSKNESRMYMEAPGSCRKSCELKESGVSSSISELRLTESLRKVLICQMESKTIRVRK